MFKNWFNRSKAGQRPQTSGATLSPNIKESILNALGRHSIPSMPQAAQRAFELSVDPKADAKDFIAIIEDDEALSARVLKVANSAFLSPSQPAESIETAVHFIGLNELRCLLNATSLSQVFPSKIRAREQLWSNNVGSALIARQLAQQLLPEKEDAAFLAGLMHDIGKLLMLQRDPEQYLKIMARAGETGRPFSEFELEVYPFDHCDVGILIGETWRFSEELNFVIGNHHKVFNNLSKEEGLSITLCHIVSAADIFAHSLGLGHQGGFGCFRNQQSEVAHTIWGALGLPQETMKQRFDSFKTTFEVEYDLYVNP